MVMPTVFQFALPRGERPAKARLDGYHALFQFALPRGERHHRHQCTVAALAVSIRAPAWGATAVDGCRLDGENVPIRAPAWGATPIVVCCLRRQTVSIRAPAWGATGDKTRTAGAMQFQFALPRGERRTTAVRTGQLAGFNSRSRVGSDARGRVSCRAMTVSIRAPAWGATLVSRSSSSVCRFQFALPRGERPSSVFTFSPKPRFQFALPRGERRAGVRGHFEPRSFNSRSRVGSDTDFHAVSFIPVVSIRAPAWGATRLFDHPSGADGFQFALPRGERRGWCDYLPAAQIVSIRAPAWGATECRCGA